MNFDFFDLGDEDMEASMQHDMPPPPPPPMDSNEEAKEENEMPYNAQFYLSVIDDVINSVKNKWKTTGGDPRLLAQIESIWKHKALLKLGIQTPEPQYAQIKNAKMRVDPNDINNLFAAFIPNPEPEKDDSDSGSDSGSKSSSDASDISSSSSDGSGSSYSSSESELNIDDDPELLAMVTPTVASDHLLCHYVSKSEKKSKKKGKSYNFDISHCHLEFEGDVRVFNNGEISINQ